MKMKLRKRFFSETIDTPQSADDEVVKDKTVRKLPKSDYLNLIDTIQKTLTQTVQVEDTGSGEMQKVDQILNLVVKHKQAQNKFYKE